jgi:hypothetical protein
MEIRAWRMIAPAFEAAGARAARSVASSEGERGGHGVEAGHAGGVTRRTVGWPRPSVGASLRYPRPSWSGVSVGQRRV